MLMDDGFGDGGSSGASATGLDPKVAGLLCYLLFWVSGVIFLVLEKDNKFIRFHALQSIFVFGSLTLVSFAISFLGILLGWFTIFAWLLYAVLLRLLWIAMVVLWVVLMYKAFQGELWKVPVVGEIASRYV